MNIDYVIPYVDCEEKIWQETYKNFKEKNHLAENYNPVRFRSFDNLDFLIDSIRKFLPFINNIYLIVSNKEQVPDNTKEKVKVVLHKDFIPSEYLPTFNSTTIEMFLHNIPMLSEHFIYGNDDIFPVNKVEETDLFNDKGYPKLYFSRLDRKVDSQFRKVQLNCQELIEKDLKVKEDFLYSFSHSVTPMLKSNNIEVFKNHKDEIRNSITPLRTARNLNQYLFSYNLLLNKKFSPIANSYSKYFDLKDENLEIICNEIVNTNYKFLCINDVVNTINYNRTKKVLKSSLKEMLDDKKSFYDFKVDYVIPYVDCSNEKWIKRYETFCKENNIKLDIDKKRYKPNIELKYLLRAINKNLPWIRDIILIVPSEEEIPNGLNLDNIRIVYDSDIVPEEYLPTFNSTTIEMFLHNIPMLSEHFIYGNDDMFPMKPMKISDFFDMSGNPKNYFEKEKMSEQRKTIPYWSHLQNGQKLLMNVDDDTVYNPPHIAIPYLKSMYKDVIKKIYLSKTITPLRNDKNINHHIVDFYNANVLENTYYPKEWKIINSITDSTLTQVLHSFKKFYNICLNSFDEKYSDKINNELETLFNTPSKYELEEDKLLSIIMPCYNSEKTLKRAVDSVLNNNYKNFELLIINDGSTDKTLEIAKSINDSRIKIFSQDNKGPGAARNLGLDNAKGYYISFMDSDDTIQPNRFKNAIRIMNESNINIVQCQFNIIKPNSTSKWSWTPGVFTPEDKVIFSTPSNDIGHSASKVYKAELLKDIRFPNCDFCEDVIFNTKAFCKSGKIKITTCYDYNYYINYGSLAHSEISLERVLKLKRCLEELNTDEYKIIYPIVYNHINKSLEKRNNSLDIPDFLL